MNWLDSQIRRYFPCPYDRGGNILVSLGVISSLVYVCMSIWYQGELNRIPENIMVLTFLVSTWRQRHILNSDLIMRLLILSVVFPLLSFTINAMIDFDVAYKYKSLNDLSKLFFFLPLAWWLGGSNRAVINMLILAFLSFISAILFCSEVGQSFTNILSGQRVDFGIHNAQHGALFFGLVFICSLIALIQSEKETSTFCKTTFLLSSSLIGVIGLIGTQTRAAYLGIIICGFIAFAKWFRTTKRISVEPRSVKNILIILLLVIGLMAGLFQQVHDGRMSNSGSDIYLLIKGEAELLPMNSIGIRVHSWLEAWKWIIKRPIAGWGRGARMDIIRLSDRFSDHHKAIFGHLHNGYLELLVGNGLIGLIFIIVLLVTLLKRIKSAANPDFYAFALYGIAFFLVINLFESFFFFWSGEFALSIILAGGYSQFLARQLGEAEIRSRSSNSVKL